MSRWVQVLAVLLLNQSELRAKLRADVISPNPTAVVRMTGALP
jgi:hypothetical protein